MNNIKVKIFGCANNDTTIRDINNTSPITGVYSRQVTYVVINDVVCRNIRRMVSKRKPLCNKHVTITQKSLVEAFEKFKKNTIGATQVFGSLNLYSDIFTSTNDLYKPYRFTRTDIASNFGNITSMEFDDNSITLNIEYDENHPYAKIIEKAQEELLCVIRYTVKGNPRKYGIHKVYDMDKIISFDLVLPDKYYNEFSDEYDKVIKGRR